ncbi:MAG: ABC transporter substrate-binding protein [Hyphomicrobiales bacterium]
MVTRRTALGLLASAAAMPRALADDLEPQFFREQLASGALPPLSQRLPKVPRVINLEAMGRLPGRHGGDIRTLIGGQKDIRLMTLYGYARLVGYDEKLQMQADILERYDVVEDRIFTFKIREGHKWSDGSLLTSEDFRYTWEDVLLNDDLSPGGLSAYLLSNGKPPLFEVIDELTVRYSWETPNPDFLPRIAAAQPLNMALPAAYLKQFHKKYQTEEKLAEFVKKYKAKKWSTLHTRMSRTYRPENPELPTLDPWHNMTEPPTEQFIFERNPYFHRVDEAGRQLPYFDRFILNISSSSIIPAKTGAGESDLQANAIDFTDYAFLKEAETRYPVKVLLWKKTQGSRLALLPNLNYKDPAWQTLFRDPRVRRALSLAIDRHEINEALFFGLGTESSDMLMPESPLYRPELAQAWIKHDPDQANALLDAAGLASRDSDEIRLLPDGRRAEIIVETAGESTLETDVLELITDYWNKIGIKLFIRTSQRDIFRSRAIGGEIMMAIWSGMDNGIATADMNPAQLAPTSDDQLQWPVWGMFTMSHGEGGTAPEVPEAAELLKLYDSWRMTTNMDERTAIWARMLSIYADQVFSIGLVNATLQPIVRSSRMVNMPDKGLYGFEPTSYFGVYMPDTFWLKKDA